MTPPQTEPNDDRSLSEDPAGTAGPGWTTVRWRTVRNGNILAELATIVMSTVSPGHDTTGRSSDPAVWPGRSALK
jgi:hypothetical protein